MPSVPIQASLLLAVFAFLGAGDEDARFNDSRPQPDVRLRLQPGICWSATTSAARYSDRMRGELVAGLDRGDSDDLVLQAFVQKYGPTVLARADHYRVQPRRLDHAVIWLWRWD